MKKTHVFVQPSKQRCPHLCRAHQIVPTSDVERYLRLLLVSFTTHLFLIPSLQICCMLAYASALTIYRHAINHMCAFRRGSRTRVRRADGSLSFSLLVILHCNHFVCASTWPFVVRSSPDGFRCGAVLCCRFPFLWLIAQTDCDCELCLLVRLIVVVFVFYFHIQHEALQCKCLQRFFST